MSTIAEKLTQLNTIKQNQKTYLGTSENDFSKYLGLFQDKIEEVLINAQQLYLKNLNSTNATFSLLNKSSNQSLQYSLDLGDTWTELAVNTNITIPGNGICLLRGKLSGNNDTNNYTKFYIRDYDLECHGNIMNLYNYENPYNTTITYSNAFRVLFENCYKLLTAPSLPATTLSQECYLGMFNGCSSLIIPPVLPATTLASACYSSMFQNCTSLTTTPALLATNLVTRCYRYMFSGCSSLTTAPTLSATTLASYCYSEMFKNCTNLSSAPALPATTLASYCYSWMFQGCTSLTTAPNLNVATIPESGYRGMFYGCSNLNYIKCLATDISAANCLYDWTNSVASSGTFVKASSMTGWPSGTSGIPANWTVQNA